jgi:hypothetical protein
VGPPIITAILDQPPTVSHEPVEVVDMVRPDVQQWDREARDTPHTGDRAPGPRRTGRVRVYNLLPSNYASTAYGGLCTDDRLTLSDSLVVLISKCVCDMR